MTRHLSHSPANPLMNPAPLATLQDISQSQRDRLAFVELRVHFMGRVRRQDLVSRFSIQTAAATRDLALYKTLSHGNVDYDTSTKTYVLADAFRPLFHFAPEHVLSWLTRGFGDGEPIPLKTWVASEIPSRLTQPDLDVLAAITRAMHQGCALAIHYHSLSSGHTQRQIVPFALIDNGLRWHVRAFDRKSRSFRDFVITRVQHPRVLAGEPIAPHESEREDIQWNRIVELDLVPHPDQPRPEITVMDYGMRDGKLSIKLRAAVAGYILRQWSVDCSPDHSLRGPEYRLWLKDPLRLYGVRNAILAPGYRGPDQQDSDEVVEAD